MKKLLLILALLTFTLLAQAQHIVTPSTTHLRSGKNHELIDKVWLDAVEEYKTNKAKAEDFLSIIVGIPEDTETLAKAREYLRQGNEIYDPKDFKKQIEAVESYAKAIEAYERVLEQSPRHYDAYREQLVALTRATYHIRNTTINAFRQQRNIRELIVFHPHEDELYDLWFTVSTQQRYGNNAYNVYITLFELENILERFPGNQSARKLWTRLVEDKWGQNPEYWDIDDFKHFDRYKLPTEGNAVLLAQWGNSYARSFNPHQNLHNLGITKLRQALDADPKNRLANWSYGDIIFERAEQEKSMPKYWQSYQLTRNATIKPLKEDTEIHTISGCHSMCAYILSKIILMGEDTPENHKEIQYHATQAMEMDKSSAFSVATVYADLEMIDRALEVMEEMLKLGKPILQRDYYENGEHLSKNLKGNPKWVALLDKYFDGEKYRE